MSLCFSVFICFVFTEAVAFFKKCMVDDPGMSTAVAAIQTLLEFMNQNAGKLVILGRVVRKPVNVNPGLNVSCTIIFSCLKMFLTSNGWYSLRLLQHKTAWQTI